MKRKLEFGLDFHDDHVDLFLGNRLAADCPPGLPEKIIRGAVSRILIVAEFWIGRFFGGHLALRTLFEELLY